MKNSFKIVVGVVQRVCGHELRILKIFGDHMVNYRLETEILLEAVDESDETDKTSDCEGKHLISFLHHERSLYYFVRLKKEDDQTELTLHRYDLLSKQE